jgi:hypothetical protein
LLDFFYALRLQVNARQTLLAGERAGLPTALTGAFALGRVSGGAIRRPFHSICRGRMRGGFSRCVMPRARVGSHPSVGGRM